MLHNSAVKMPYMDIWENYLAGTIGVVPACNLMNSIRNKYKELCIAHGKVTHLGLKRHLYGNLFPQIAAYKILLDEMPQKSSHDIVEKMHLLTLNKLKQLNKHLYKFYFCFSVYRVIVPVMLKYGHPSAGWDIELLENSRRNICARVYRCFYFNVVKDYKVPELITIYCNGDDYIFKEVPSPYIKWGRTTTMPNGGDYCDVVYHKKYSL
jgi:hypothetical protein